MIVPRPGNQPENPDRDDRKNVEINIGKACNNRCVFCIDGLPKREDRSYMDFGQMQRELERWYADGYRSVGFLGGEPTTYPRIVDSVAYARSLGFTRIAIATNATKLRLRHFADALLDAGLTRITVSMHGHTAELEDRLTRVPGNFEKKVAALRYLKHKQDTEGALRDGLSVNIVLNGWNAPHLPKMMQFFYRRLGLADLRVNFIRPEGYAEGDAELTPRYADVTPILVKAILLNEHHFKRTFTFGGVPLCVLPRTLRNSEALLRRYMGEYRDLSTACSIRSGGGDVMPPGQVPPGQERGRRFPSTVVAYDAAEQRARFNWQDRKRQDLKDRPPPCRVCRLGHVCEGVWKGYLDIWGYDELRPVR
ncbi:MAG: radical SAM protein [Deltaproteobacteria bacterium]|nr:MAG: radical SAM protein [Deltaproteobacteria bacterium]